MSDLRADAAAREAAGWEAFSAALAPIPRERWEEPGILPGWTLKELLWHVAGWMQECAVNLEAMRDGRYVDAESTDEQIDARNAELAAAGRAMDVDAVWLGLLEARELVLQRWSDLPEVDASAVESLAGETFAHYEEHRADLERFSA